LTSGPLSSACVDFDCGYAPSAFDCGSCCDVVSGSCSCFDPFAGDFGCGCDPSASPQKTSADLETCCCCCCCCFETCGVAIASPSTTASGGVSLISCVSGRPTACATWSLTEMEVVAVEAGYCPRPLRPQVTVAPPSPLRHLQSAPCHDHARLACQRRCLMLQRRPAPPPWGQSTRQAPLTREPWLVELQRKGHRSLHCCRQGPMRQRASSRLPLRLKRLRPPRLPPPLPPHPC